MSGTGGARAVGAGGGGGGLGAHAEGCGDCFGVEDGCFGVECEAEPMGWRVRLWLKRLGLPRARGKGASPRRFASPAKSSPLSSSLTCCGYWTFGTMTKAVFGAPFAHRAALESAMSSIADKPLQHYC